MPDSGENVIPPKTAVIMVKYRESPRNNMVRYEKNFSLNCFINAQMKNTVVTRNSIVSPIKVK